MRILAPAKINLHLRVGRARSDGFHPLLSWMCTAGLFDTLTFVRRSGSGVAVDSSTASFPVGAPNDGSWFSLSTDHPRLPTDSRNLVTKVATALADALGRDGEGPIGRRERVSAFLVKRIPSGAGLAGGSSDGAAALRALATMWKLDWSRKRLSDFAAKFGSDLSFFFFGPSAICTGRGEIVRPIAPPTASHAVLMLPAIEMPTPAVYRRFDEMNLGAAGNEAIANEPDFASWTTLKSDALLAELVNDLEAPAFAIRPELGELRATLERGLKKVVRMSGSGSSLFTLCDDGDSAERLAAQVRDGMNLANVSVMTVRLAPAGDMYPVSDTTVAS